MIETIQLQVAKPGIPARFLVRRNGYDIGLVEKFRDDRCTRNPWKAFAGIGARCRYLGPYWNDGGAESSRSRAVRAVVAAHLGA